MAITPAAATPPAASSFTLGTLQGKADPKIVSTLQSMATYINQLQARIAALETAAKNAPEPLTMDFIQSDLEVSGTHPLDLTGLIGSAST